MPVPISELADQVSVSTDTLRYYERLGLVPAPARAGNGYRLYEEAVADRVRFIKNAQRTGLRLADIKELLDIWDRSACPCGHTTQVVERRLAEVDTELARLQAMRHDLVALGLRNEDCANLSAPDWWCAHTRERERR